MNLYELADRMGNKMKFWDFALLKLSVLFSTLFLITVWPAFRNLVMSFDWYWYLIIAILLSAPLIKKMFSE